MPRGKGFGGSKNGRRRRAGAKGRSRGLWRADNVMPWSELLRRMGRIVLPVRHGRVFTLENDIVTKNRPDSSDRENRESGRHYTMNTNARQSMQGRGARRMKAKVDSTACTGCGVCQAECPNGAIEMRETAVVNEGLCTGCGLCVDACPAGALTME